MLEKLRHNPESLLTPDDRSIALHQARFLSTAIKNLNLNTKVRVDPRIQVRDENFFRNRRTMAYPGLDELSIAIVAASGDSRKDTSGSPLSTLLVFPTEKDSGLLIDDATGTVYTDSFWVCEDGKFQPIKTTSPVPINGVNVEFDSAARWNGNPNMEHRLHVELSRLTNDKIKTREVLQKSGIPIPNGVDFASGSQETANERVDAFIEANPNANGFVLKKNHGSGGHGVTIFETMEANQLKKLLQDMLARGSDMLLEERIVPPQLSQLQDRRSEQYGNDYNFRVILTADQSNPQVIDAEIRHRGKKGLFSEPVNISHDAKASRLSKLGNPQLEEEIYDISQRATKAVCSEVFGDKAGAHGIIGVDVMIGEDGRVVILEVNSGMVGGFGTLSRLDKKPLKGIKQVLVPHSKSLLEEQFQARPTSTPEGLRRLPLTQRDRRNLYSFYAYGERWEDASNLLLEIKKGDDSGEKAEPTIVGLIKLGRELGKFDMALSYLENAFANNGLERNSYIAYKTHILRKADGPAAAREFLLKELENADGSEDKIYQQLFMTALFEKDENEAMRVWQERHGTSQNIDFAMYESFAAGYDALGHKRRSAHWKKALHRAVKKFENEAKEHYGKKYIDLLQKDHTSELEKRGYIVEDTILVTGPDGNQYLLLQVDNDLLSGDDPEEDILAKLRSMNFTIESLSATPASPVPEPISSYA